MHNLKISTAQFEHRSGDKNYNLSVIDQLSQKASAEGSKVIAFHECSVTGYTFARHFSNAQMSRFTRFICYWSIFDNNQKSEKWKSSY